MTDHRTPRDTTRAMREAHAERLLFLASGMADGSPSSFIEAQESAGQREMVNATTIPTDGAADDDLTALGFTLGPVVDGDPMFREATLPEGWKREGSDHAMGSYIVDELGRRRCSIFYKSAFYDRSAHISVITVSGYVNACLWDDEAPVLDDSWATRDEALAAIDEVQQEQQQRVELWVKHGDSGREEEARAQVAKCVALRAKIEEAGAA